MAGLFESAVNAFTKPIQYVAERAVQPVAEATIGKPKKPLLSVPSDSHDLRSVVIPVESTQWLIDFMKTYLRKIDQAFSYN